MATATKTWQTIADRKRKSILASVPEQWRIKVPSREEQRDVTGHFIHQYLDTSEIGITNADAVTILEQTAAGAWSAAEVTRAFCHRAALAHQLTNCLHQDFFDVAIAEAERLDEYFAHNMKTVGPLHGLPISMKDQFHSRGTDATMGYIGWIGKFEGRERTESNGLVDSQIVGALRKMGAVFYCKTSVPHSLMAGETVNNIIGYTYNPRNRLLSAGGSSGGEGALIGLRGSCVGLGSDIGGSIRVPSAFNGIFGIRPSHGRLPYQGVPISMDGQESIPCVVGPMASTVRSLKMMFQRILEGNPWIDDPMTLNLPWRFEHEQFVIDRCDPTKQTGKLAIAIFENDGVVRPDPPVRRALSILVEAIQSAGHEVIPWNPPSHEEAWDLAYDTWMFDGGNDIHSSLALSGEPIAEQLSMAFGSKPTPEKGAAHVAATNVKIREYRKRYLDYWNSTTAATSTGRPVDAFISPLAPFAAARPGKYKHYSYSTAINVLDYTAVAMPVTCVDKIVDIADTMYEALSEKDEECHSNYDADLYHGAHVGVQIVTRRLEEEKAFALTEYLVSLLQ